ncbi:hypothetical protein HPP92_004834 [Vanilla planifolia]|uniref:Uncharacterized protein n=1 Tax=Vanilla planifolia TaxID=51239 RepID=A0A835RFY2_VANPL|nr:hypothetical protein HPP92_004834 [Vanilla planifolia]
MAKIDNNEGKGLFSFTSRRQDVDQKHVINKLHIIMCDILEIGRNQYDRD